jgi:hypothetical protein
MSPFREIIDSGYEFRKTQVYHENAPNAVSITPELAQRLSDEILRDKACIGGNLTETMQAGFAKYGLDALIGLNVYGMKINSVTATETKAYKY